MLKRTVVLFFLVITAIFFVGTVKAAAIEYGQYYWDSGTSIIAHTDYGLGEATEMSSMYALINGDIYDTNSGQNLTANIAAEIIHFSNDPHTAVNRFFVQTADLMYGQYFWDSGTSIVPHTDYGLGEAAEMSSVFALINGDIYDTSSGQNLTANIAAGITNFSNDPNVATKRFFVQTGSSASVPEPSTLLLLGSGLVGLGLVRTKTRKRQWAVR